MVNLWIEQRREAKCGCQDGCDHNEPHDPGCDIRCRFLILPMAIEQRPSYPYDYKRRSQNQVDDRPHSSTAGTDKFNATGVKRGQVKCENRDHDEPDSCPCSLPNTQSKRYCIAKTCCSCQPTNEQIVAGKPREGCE